MKKNLILSIILGFFGSLEATAITLKVVVQGLKTSKGQVQLSLEDSVQSYYGKADPLKIATIAAAEGVVEFEFKDLEPGTYSLKAFHDENANQEFDLSLIGIPKEAYGISNNARAALGMPDYDQAKFQFGDDQTIHVTVKKHINF